MNQQLSAGLGVRPATPTPAATGSSVASNDQSPSFATTLTDALDDVAAPATDAGLGLAVSDDGNSSPENGNDSPLLLQLANPASVPPQAIDPGLDKVGDSAATTLLPDPVQSPLDASAASELAAQSTAAQLLVASTTMGVNNAAATSVRAPVSVPNATSVAAASLLSAGQGEPTALTTSAPAHTAAQDSSPQQQHNSPLNQEWLTTLASVLVPVKDSSVERFELALPAAQTGAAPDATVNTGGSPLSSGLSGAPTLTATPVSASGKPELMVPQAPGQVGWSDVFAERVSFAVRQNLQEAEIRLNPPQLGQVDVRIVMSNDQATLMFSSPHGAVREAIEQSLGRLRDMLADSGFNLVNVDVSDKSLAQQRNDAREQRDSSRNGSQPGYRADFELAANAPEVFRSGTGSVDYYV